MTRSLAEGSGASGAGPFRLGFLINNKVEGKHLNLHSLPPSFASLPFLARPFVYKHFPG